MGKRKNIVVVTSSDAESFKTRVEYIKDYLDMEIDIAEEMKARGQSLDMEKHIGNLHVMKHLFTTLIFGDDEKVKKLKDDLKITKSKLSRKSAKKPERKNKRLSLKQSYYLKFREAGGRHNYDNYITWCLKASNKVPEDAIVYSKGYFKKLKNLYLSYRTPAPVKR